MANIRTELKLLYGSVGESSEIRWLKTSCISARVKVKSLRRHWVISDCGVVSDDLQARKCAQIFDLPLIGTVGLLVKAKKEKLIDRVKPAFEKLVESGLYLDSQLIKRILASAGE
jgi:predicted nucleic acid-binding protein